MKRPFVHVDLGELKEEDESPEEVDDDEGDGEDW